MNHCTISPRAVPDRHCHRRRPRDHGDLCHRFFRQGQGRPDAGDRSRRSRRAHHPRGPGEARSGNAGDLRGSRLGRAAFPKSPPSFFLVDPLDGTKEFISRNGEFTVNIALRRDRRAGGRRGLCPGPERIFWGETGHRRGPRHVEQGRHASSWKPIARARHAASRGATVVASRSHRDAATDDYLKTVR